MYKTQVSMMAVSKLCNKCSSLCLNMVLIFAFVCLCVTTSQSAPINSTTKVMMYLMEYGYMNPKDWNPSNSGKLMSETVFSEAIAEFQAFAGLNVTGDLNEETQVMMSMPRCGVKDKVGYGTKARRKRYELQGSRWRVKELTFKVSKYPANLRRSEVDDEVQRSFDIWSEYTDLTFVRKTSGNVHIEIRFEKGEHGDGDPFDGAGGTLAHAYFPVYGGDAHFDDAETWSIRSSRGTNLFQVAAHEFGHSLGLSHSDVRKALMAPFYRGYQPDFQFDQDDIKGIQALYGKKTITTGKTVPKTTTTAKPTVGGKDDTGDGELCNDATIDAITTAGDSNTYSFKGDNYWKLTDDGIANGYPRSITKDWDRLPGNLDAVFTWTNGKTYFFKGNNYWRFTNMKMDSEYPKSISSGFQGIPDNIDAAFVWSGNGKIYFFKGSKFWRYDPSQRPPVKSTYPKEIKNWEGIPNNINAALQYSNGFTYFFKNGKYWRFNDRTFAVETADPPFPRAAGYWWFGCRSINAGLSGTTKSSGIKAGPQTTKDDDDVGDNVMDAVDGDSDFDSRRPTYGIPVPRTGDSGTPALPSGTSWHFITTIIPIIIVKFIILP